MILYIIFHRMNFRLKIKIFLNFTNDCEPKPRARGYKTFFMLNSAKHEIFLLIVGILTLLAGKNLSLKNAVFFFYIFIYEHFHGQRDV